MRRLRTAARGALRRVQERTGPAPSPPISADGRPPNLLLFMTDQHRWDALGCAGGWVQTPNLDRLATEGVRFPHAYTNSPVCVPARVSLALGRYPHNHGVWNNKAYTLSPRSNTWMKGIRDAGYATSLFGKTHLHPHRGDLRDSAHLLNSYGLEHVDEIAGPRASVRSRSNLTDEWEKAGLYDAYKADLRRRYDEEPWAAYPSPLPLEHYPDVYVGRRAAEYLEAYRQDRPWFAWVSFSGPHEPWDTPEPYASRHDPASMPPAAVHRDDDHVRPKGLLDDRLRDNSVSLSPDEVARLRANYAGNVSLIDDQIGKVLDVVRARGELDNTVVALVSDHGEMNGDHDLLYKQNFLDPAARIPFVLRVPGAARTGDLGTMVELMDVGATFLELAGGRPHRSSFARSLVPLITGSEDRHRSEALCEHRGEHMLATSQWKIAFNRAGDPYLLFDLDTDPQETTNLAGLPEYADIESELTSRLKARLSASGG